MRQADLTAAARAREMANTHDCVSDSMGSCENPSKEVRFSIFQIPSQGVAAQVGDLDHAGECAVNE